MAFFIKGIGDAAQRINEITPRFDAQILNFLTQSTPGVCWHQATRFALTRIDRGVIIGPGLVQAHGYFGMSDANHQINVTIPSAGTQFARVFAEINLSRVPHQFSIRISQQSTSSVIALTQNNLVTSPSGVHQIPLYLLTIQSNGNITSTDQRPQMTRPQNARHANDATNSTNATNLVANGTINNTATATTQTRTNNTTRVATTAFVHSVVDHANRFNPTNNGLNIWSGRIVLPNGLILLWREGQSQNETFPWAFPNRCIHVGYMGHWGPSTNNAPWASDIAINRDTVTRTGFRWTRQSGTGRINDRKYFALGY